MTGLLTKLFTPPVNNGETPASAGSGLIRVALDVPLPQLFDYVCVEATKDDIGRRVVVPFGNRTAVGIIIDVGVNSDIANARMKNAERVMRDVAPLPPQWLELATFCSEYYQRPLGEVLLNS